MALLKPSKAVTKTQVRINIDKELLADIRAYCEFAHIRKVDEFIAQAAQLVFKKDKSWQEHKK